MSRGSTSPERLRTVLVTGASRGIGFAIAEALLDRGHSVVGMARTVPQFDHERWHFVAMDLAPRDGLGARLIEALASATTPPIDAWVSCVGAPAFGFVPQLSEARIREGIESNLLSPMFTARALLPTLTQCPASDIVLIGSESALAAEKRGSVYCAAKFGLRGFALALRKEATPNGIRVTQIHPGAVRTAFFDELDFEPGADPENALLPTDIAHTVVHILESRPEVAFDEITLAPLKKVFRRK